MEKMIDARTRLSIERIAREYIPYKSSDVGIYDMNKTKRDGLISNIISLMEGQTITFYSPKRDTGPR